MTAQIDLAGTKKGSSVTLANATGVDIATHGSNTITFTGGTGLTSFVVTGDGTNSFDLTGPGAVATSKLTVDTSASTGADLVDLGGNWNANDPIKGNGDTTLGLLLTTTTPLPTVPWTGVSALQLDTGSLGNLFLTGVTGLTTVIYENNPGNNNVVLNNVVGVDSLIFKGDGTSGSQQFGSIWLNGDTSPTLSVTFENAVPLLISSDVTIGTWGYAGDGIVADGVAAVTIDTTGVLGTAGDFILGGGFTDDALTSLTLISNAENNWIDTISTRDKQTLQLFDASKATGNLTVRFEDGAFANGAVVNGAVGTNHVTIEDSGTPQNQPVTVFVNLGNGGRATYVGLWDVAALTGIRPTSSRATNTTRGRSLTAPTATITSLSTSAMATTWSSPVWAATLSTPAPAPTSSMSAARAKTSTAASSRLTWPPIRKVRTHPDQEQQRIDRYHHRPERWRRHGRRGLGLENVHHDNFETTVNLGTHTAPAEIDAVEAGNYSILNLNHLPAIR